MRSKREVDESVDEAMSTASTAHQSKASAPGARRKGAALLGRAGIAALVVAVVGAGTWALSRAAVPEAGPTTTEIPALAVQAVEVAPGSIAPVNAALAGAPPANQEATSGEAAPQPEAKSAKQMLADWADRAASAVGVPARALVAYGNAELTMRSVQPSCKLSWATLAGLGRIESNHGQYGGAVLGTDGRPSKPIIGVPLNGAPGVRAVADTDGGRYDGDGTQDRAVGPLQFIPSTWAKFASDGTGDGKADPQRIDDAALAAAHYLCTGGRNMASAQGWWSGVMSYNNSIEYAQKVFGLADGYAKSARTVRVNQ